MKLIFCLQINSKVFYKFFVSLQYLKKEVSDEVEFLHADKHNSLVQIDDMVFDRDGKALHII